MIQSAPFTLSPSFILPSLSPPTFPLCRTPIGQTTCCCWRRGPDRRMWLDGEVVNLCIQRVVNPGRRGVRRTHTALINTNTYTQTVPLTCTNTPHTKIIHTPRKHRQTHTFKSTFPFSLPRSSSSLPLKEHLVKQRSALLRTSLFSALFFVLSWLAICLEMN